MIRLTEAEKKLLEELTDGEKHRQVYNNPNADLKNELQNLDLLSEKGLIQKSPKPNGGYVYRIVSTGREYLDVSNAGLLRRAWDALCKPICSVPRFVRWIIGAFGTIVLFLIALDSALTSAKYCPILGELGREWSANCDSYFEEMK